MVGRLGSVVASRHQVVFLVRQLLTFLPGKEAILPWQLYTLPWKVTALLLSRHQAVFLVRQLLTFLLGKEAVLSPELYTFPRKMSAHPRLLPSVCTVREIAPLNPLAPPRQGRVITPRAGRQGNRCPPGTGLHSLPRRSIQPPGRATPPPYPPVGPTKVLQMKNPTLSGSLTCPTNP